MENRTRDPVRTRGDALALIKHIVADFDIATMKEGGRQQGGAIGWAARRVFDVLAGEPTVFLMPVPFDRDGVGIAAGYTGPTVAQAMKRLIEQGLATMSGSRSDQKVRLHLPPHVVAAYRQHAARTVREQGRPFNDDEIERALGLLDG